MPGQLSPIQHQALGTLATNPPYLDEPAGTVYPDRAGIASLGVTSTLDRMPVHHATYAALVRYGFIEEFWHEPSGKRLGRVSVAGSAALAEADQAVREAAWRDAEAPGVPVLTSLELHHLGRAQAARRPGMTATEWYELPHAVQVRLEALGYFEQDGPDPQARRLLTAAGARALAQYRQEREQHGSTAPTGWFVVWYRTNPHGGVSPHDAGHLADTGCTDAGAADLYALREGRRQGYGAYTLYRAASAQAVRDGEFKMKQMLTAIPPLP